MDAEAAALIDAENTHRRAAFEAKLAAAYTQLEGDPGAAAQSYREARFARSRC